MDCQGCFFEKLPKCTMRSIFNGKKLEEIITDKSLSQIQVPICHKQAQYIKEDKMFKGQECDACSLCDIVCGQGCEKINIDIKLEKVLFSNLMLMNVFFSTLLPEVLVVTEVKAKGNAREKRVDLLFKCGNVCHFVKVLDNKREIAFYSRSYDEVVKYYSDRYPSYRFYKNILIPSTMSISNDKQVEGLFIQQVLELFKR